jgi:hypothetical protein
LKAGLLSEYGFAHDARTDRAGGPKAPGAPDALPCQNSDNSNEGGKLNSSQRKIAYALKENVRLLAREHGIERLGFLTLTFADKVQDIREAQRRFNSLSTGILRKRYREWLGCVERQKSGRVHFHLLVVIRDDIRTGLDFEAVRRGVYNSAPRPLRAEWVFWRKTAPQYGFGRTEMLPIRSSGNAIAAYLGKYIAKHIGSRLQLDKGARLVRYSRGAARVSARFSWNSPGSYVFRHKCALLATLTKVGADMEVAKAKWRHWWGPRWVYKLGPIFNLLKLPVYPTGRHCNVDHNENDHIPIDLKEIEPRLQWDMWEAIAKCFAILGAQLK